MTERAAIASATDARNLVTLMTSSPEPADMARRSVERRSGVVVLAVGAALLAASVAHHATEIDRIDRVGGPMLALALDGALALAVVYAGYRLADSDLAPAHRWRVVEGCLPGIVVLVGTTTAGILIRRFEGRFVSEPSFQLLLAAGAGAVAGLVGGYYNVRTRINARQADRATATLRFVNDLFRHDVRNHMSAIIVHADIVETETDDEAVADSAAVVREQADEVTELVERAGAIAAAVSENDDVGCVDLAAVVGEVVDQVAATYDVEIRTDLPDAAPVAANDAVESVVTNLVENAAEHGTPGVRAAARGVGRPPSDGGRDRTAVAEDAGERAASQIEVAVANRDESVRLRVADDGPGVPDSRKRELFESDSEDRHGGGLHLVKTLVESYGGDVWVEDAEAGGAAFVVDLPRAGDE